MQGMEGGGWGGHLFSLKTLLLVVVAIVSIHADNSSVSLKCYACKKCRPFLLHLLVAGCYIGVPLSVQLSIHHYVH